jgi:uncharacterized protein YndB with AHSA1/START domain
MAHVAGEVVVRRPVDEVFDFVADVRNEPLYNPSMVRTELLTPEPVGLGTRSRAELRSRGRTVEVRAEITAYERPTLLGSRHRSSVPSSRSALDTHGTLTFEPVDEGTRMRWSWQLEPRGAYRLLGPLVGLLGARLERRIWTGMKRYLEAEAR